MPATRDEIPEEARWGPLADPRVLDGALVLTCLGLTWLAARTPWSPMPTAVVLTLGAVGSLAQWVRRTRPLVAATLGAVAFGLAGNPGPWLIGVYSGAAFGARRRLWAPMAVGLAGCALFQWIDIGRLQADDVLFAAAATVLVTVIGAYAATRRALVASLRQRADQVDAERLLRDDRARVAERNRIAREMHDVLAHKVSLIALHAGALEVHAATMEGGYGDAPGRVRQGAALIRVTAREALQELRTVLGVLHAQPGSGGPGEPFADLAALVRESTRAGQRVDLLDRVGPLPPATARVVYRVAQEGLTNAHRYAPEAPTTVTVDRGEDGRVDVAVRNRPGSGRDTDLPGSGSGLVGLAERIQLVGGSMRSGPLGPGGRDGWELRAAVPWLDPQVEDGPEPAGGAGTEAGATPGPTAPDPSQPGAAR